MWTEKPKDRLCLSSFFSPRVQLLPMSGAQPPLECRGGRA